MLVALARWIFSVSATFLGAYAIRHYLFSMRRLLVPVIPDRLETEGFALPRISVIVPMHNEELVAIDVLTALVASDYDPERLEILAVNDRSTDATGLIVDLFARQHQGVRAIHRSTGNGGKAGALQVATEIATGEVLLVFDADYVPGPEILKMLVAPFADPQVGAVMGRVVPHNDWASMLSGLLGLERASGYQVAQQARSGLGLSAQFGGTVGGVRASALRAVGGWNAHHSVTEDTDLTCRLILAGWKIAYINRAECHEQVPQTWAVRSSQIRRWVIGHTDCFHRYGREVLRCKKLGIGERTDLFLLLACYWTAPAMLLAWGASFILLFLGEPIPAVTLSAALVLVGSQIFSGQASFFEQATASHLDQDGARVLMLPLGILNGFAATGAICGALFAYYAHRLRGGTEFDWHKTIRYRRTDGNGSGNGAGGA